MPRQGHAGNRSKKDGAGGRGYSRTYIEGLIDEIRKRIRGDIRKEKSKKVSVVL